MTTIVVLTVIAATTILLLFRVAREHSNSRISAEIASLLSSVNESVGPKDLAARWSQLPEPVQRYLRYAIPAGTPAVRVARLTHGGLFRTKPDQKWRQIKGEEYFSVASPGFIWTASIHPAPFLWITASDRLVCGNGNMLVKVNSVLTIANASGPELDQGASLRWLAEAVWFPYGFVAECVHWDGIDNDSASATLRQEERSVKAIFQFDEDGRLINVRADRYRDVGAGRFVITPWSGQCSEYREFSGLRVPTLVDVGWEIDQQRFGYARFEIIKIDYNVTEPSC